MMSDTVIINAITSFTVAELFVLFVLCTLVARHLDQNKIVTDDLPSLLTSSSSLQLITQSHHEAHHRH